MRAAGNLMIRDRSGSLMGFEAFMGNGNGDDDDDSSVSSWWWARGRVMAGTVDLVY